VFERFYRADPARTRTANGDRGSGLGLAIVAAITAAHGGIASVHTGPGQGATFRLALPAADPAPSEPAPGTDADADADTGTGTGTGTDLTP
jgi:two-component system OmpR family sensor kinase